jgi:hypothetical protein
MTYQTKQQFEIFTSVVFVCQQFPYTASMVIFAMLLGSCLSTPASDETQQTHIGHHLQQGP